MSNRTHLDPPISPDRFDLATLMSDPMQALSDSVLPPSAILTDGIIWIPLFAVSRMSLTEAYRLPPIGSSGLRAAVGNSDDSVTLSALLIGDLRYLWKQLLELLADLSRKGGSLGMLTGGGLNGLILVTRMAVRLDMQVENLTFTQSAQRRDVIEVSISLRHVPRPGPQHLLVDIGMTALNTAAEFAL